MNTVIRLLVVEDDDGQFQTYSDAADEIRGANGDILFALTHKKTSTEAKQALLSNDFDAAIVDLNLNSSDLLEASGNEILETITESHRFPVFVVSGNLQHLKEEIKDKQSSFLKFYNREIDNKTILDEIKKIWGTGITKILGGRGLIEQLLVQIFWNHLSKDLHAWTDADRSSEQALLRFTVSHLSEYLEEENYNTAEFYIKPPIRKHLATGDISEEDGTKFILLSPACDIAVRNEVECENGGIIPEINASRLTLARLIKFDYKELIEEKIIQTTDNRKQLKSKIQKIVQGQQDKYVYLPPYNQLEASIIDLQNLYAIELSDYLCNYQRIATIAGPFLKDIQARFSSYYGRQGQPDLDKQKLIDIHTNTLTKDRIDPS